MIKNANYSASQRNTEALASRTHASKATDNSEKLTMPLLALIMAQERTLDARGMAYTQKKIRKSQLKEKEENYRKSLEVIKETAPRSSKSPSNMHVRKERQVG